MTQKKKEKKDRVTKKEKEQRVLQLIKTMLSQPDLSLFELRQVAIDTWGISERQSYRYVAEVNEYLKKIADEDVQKEKGRILAQLDDLYVKAQKRHQYNICIAVLKQKCTVLGLDSLNLNHDFVSDLTINVKPKKVTINNDS